ncbi:MAG: amidohydrolase [Deltaproteobacteria bacterium]|nr:amidohydrolase [Deltaproteobacteria bacterium]
MEYWQPLDTTETATLIDWRRALHCQPELSLVEHDTQRALHGWLSGMGLDPVPVGGTGLACALGRGETGQVLMLRADMDALPVQEHTGLAFASQRPGKMHACGHDAHMACLLAVAKRLIDHQDQIPGTVVLAFQPGEEDGQGAVKMIRDGLLDGQWCGRPELAVQAALGLHVWSKLPTGTVSAVAGPIMAAVDDFHITVKGCGGHGALPHQTRDAVVAGAAVVQALQTLASRRIDPLDPVVVTVGSIQGGTTFNVVAETCELRGTVRTFSPDLYERLPAMLTELAARTAQAYECTAETVYRRYAIALHNDADQVERVARAAAGARGVVHVDRQMRMMGGEDFAFFAEKVPSCFFFVGCGPLGAASEPHHSPRFVVDEAALPIASEVMLRAVADFFA